MATSIPFQIPGDEFTGFVTGTVVGATFVKSASAGGSSGNFGVQTCTAGAKPAGVAAQDAAAGTDVTVYSGPGIITEVTVGAGGNLTAGTEVQSDANGNAIAFASGVKAGLVMADAIVGAKAAIKIY